MFSFPGIGPKTKTQNWRKVSKTCRIPIKTSLTLSKGLENLLKYTGRIFNQVKIFFHLGKRSSYYQFLFEKKFKRKE